MKSLLLLVTTLITVSSFGQEFIKGTISDSNETLPFANILIKHTTKGVYTDVDGNFAIEAKPTDTLQISYLGYKNIDILVGKQKDLNIVLDDYEELDTVVIYSYYNGRKISCGISCSYHYIDETIDSKSIVLYPNPSQNGIFNLKSSNDFSEVNIIVADLTGQIVLNKTYNKSGAHISVDLSRQPSGIYIINLSTNGTKISSIKAIRL